MSEKGFFGFLFIDWGLIALFCMTVAALSPLFVEEAPDDILYDSYELNEQNTNFVFLIGEANLFRDKERFGDCPEIGNASYNVRAINQLPIDYDFLFEMTGEILLETADADVSVGNIVTLKAGEIDFKRIDGELTVQGITEAGEESEYDFYAGTYDSGYLVGGYLDATTEHFNYDIIAERDKRIRETAVGDVTGDGNNEVIVATHYDGITEVYYPHKDWESEIINKERYGKNETFNHEVIVEDITGNGIKDIVTTPSEPNTWEEEQKGVVKMFTFSAGDWQTYETEELDRSHIRKVVLNPEDGSIVGGVGQRTEPYWRPASFIKYEYINNSLKKVGEIESQDSLRNLYPFLVKRSEENLIVGIASNSYAHVISAKDFEELYIEKFSDSFEAFYTADAFDYTGDGDEELAIVHDGKIGIYSVDVDGMELLDSIQVYKDFDSIVWSLRAIEI